MKPYNWEDYVDIKFVIVFIWQLQTMSIINTFKVYYTKLQDTSLTQYNNLFMVIQCSYSPTVKRLICFHNGYFWFEQSATYNMSLRKENIFCLI